LAQKTAREQMSSARRLNWEQRLLFLVRGADELHVFVWIFVKFGFAVLAAEFHFLAFIDKPIRLAHVAAEFIAGDGTGLEQIRHRIGIGDRVAHRRGQGHAAATPGHRRVARGEFAGQRQNAESARGQKEVLIRFFHVVLNVIVVLFVLNSSLTPYTAPGKIPQVFLLQRKMTAFTRNRQAALRNFGLQFHNVEFRCRRCIVKSGP
jgi:hypothetical protein